MRKLLSFFELLSILLLLGCVASSPGQSAAVSNTIQSELENDNVAVSPTPIIVPTTPEPTNTSEPAPLTAVDPNLNPIHMYVEGTDALENRVYLKVFNNTPVVLSNISFYYMILDNENNLTSEGYARNVTLADIFPKGEWVEVVLSVPLSNRVGNHFSIYLISSEYPELSMIGGLAEGTAQLASGNNQPKPTK